MEIFAPFLLLLFVWIFVALPVSIAKKQAGQNGAARNGAARPAQRTGTANPPASEKPKPAAAERLVPLSSSLTEPDHNDSYFVGSLGPVSTEGFDPCHEDQLKGLEPVCRPGREPEADLQETSRLPLGWTPNEVVNGIIMSEILNRKKH